MGLPYVTVKKMRQAKIPKASNCIKFRFQSTSKISAEVRDILCRKHWNLTYAEKKKIAFITDFAQVERECDDAFFSN